MPDRPGSVISLFVAVLIAGGGIVVAVRSSMGGHLSMAEDSWNLYSAILSGLILVCGIAFILGYGWSRAGIGVLFIIQAIVPWLLLDPKYPLALKITPLACFVFPAAGVVMAVLMYVAPTVREWLRGMKSYRVLGYVL